MHLEKYQRLFLNPIEEELHKWIDNDFGSYSLGLKAILAYHLGWEGERSRAEVYGKRIRPLLLLLCTEATGGDWRCALPAAASVELAHNFSLIHDDIQDQSQTRRGRETVWKKWGVAQAINAGDLMFTLANRAMVGLHELLDARIVMKILDLFLTTCGRLTSGQYLDIAYEQQSVITTKEYFQMVSGKTAALLSASAEIGAIISGSSSKHQQAFRDFGEYLGLAYQLHDDYLGIWGQSTRTGKSSQSDIINKKKTFPILYGLETNREFALYWNKPGQTTEEINEMTNLLAKLGAQEKTINKEAEYTRKALDAVKMGAVNNEAFLAIKELTNVLLQRDN